MDSSTIIMGGIPILLGVAVGAHQAQGGKPETMKVLQNHWGKQDGSLIHFVVFCLLPIAIGGVILFVHANGGLSKIWEHGMP